RSGAHDGDPAAQDHQGCANRDHHDGPGRDSGLGARWRSGGLPRPAGARWWGWCVDRHSFLAPLSTVVTTPPKRCRAAEPLTGIDAKLTAARSASRMTRASQSPLVWVDPADAIRFAPLLDLDCVTQRLDRLRIRHTLDIRVCPLRITGLWLLVCHFLTA